MPVLSIFAMLREKVQVFFTNITLIYGDTCRQCKLSNNSDI